MFAACRESVVRNPAEMTERSGIIELDANTLLECQSGGNAISKWQRRLGTSGWKREAHTIKTERLLRSPTCTCYKRGALTSLLLRTTTQVLGSTRWWPRGVGTESLFFPVVKSLRVVALISGSALGAIHCSTALWASTASNSATGSAEADASAQLRALIKEYITVHSEAAMEFGKSLLRDVSSTIASLFAPQLSFHGDVTAVIDKYAPEKQFKGIEYVGALGELYAKLLFGGSLANESHEHDLDATDGSRLSVKTRRGTGRGWSKSGALPSIDSAHGPNGLVFVNLNDDYTPRKIWRYDWQYLKDSGRLKAHVVRKRHRSFVFFVAESKDQAFEVYSDIDATQHVVALQELLAACRIDPTSDDPPHWSADPTLVGALERYGERLQLGDDKITLDLTALERYIYDSNSPAYRVMKGMHTVWRDEGTEGSRGAPRLVMALLQLLSEHRVKDAGSESASAMPMVQSA